MTWIYMLPLLVLSDILLYIKYYKPFAKRYYFLDYGIAVGWMMAYKLRKTHG